MKILHAVESYLPQVHGMSEVVRQLSERLVLKGHDVTVVTSYDAKRLVKIISGVKIVEFKITGNAVWGIWGEKEEYQSFLLDESYDVICFFAAHQWATDLALPILDSIKSKKIFVPTGFSGFYQPIFKSYFENLRITMKKFDHSVFLSNDYRDINFAREIGIKNFSLIPNGADEREFITPEVNKFRNDFGISENELLLLSVGSHTGKKGHAEAIQILKRLKNTGPITLLIVGNLPSTGEGTHKFMSILKSIVKRIINYQGGGDCLKDCLTEQKKMSGKLINRRLLVKKLSREETIKAFYASDLFLFPSNIECSPIVLFEANAAGLPFFTTNVGNAKEISDWTNGGVILPTIFKKNMLGYAKIKESTELIDEYLKSPEKLKKLGKAGQEKVIQGFTWKNITQKYESLYKELNAKT